MGWAADYTFSGRYQIHDAGIQVTYTLSEGGKVAETRVVDLLPAAFARYRTKPLLWCGHYSLPIRTSLLPVRE